MDEFNIDDSIDSSFSDDGSIDSFESSGDSFDVMDTAEVPTFEEMSFDDVESSGIEDYSLDDTEILSNEVDDIMGNVEMEELTFDDEIIEDVSPIETLENTIEQPIEETSFDSINAMEDVEPEVLEFDAQGAYDAIPNSEQEIILEDGSVDTLDHIQANLETEPELREQTEYVYEARPNSEQEIVLEDGSVDTLDHIQANLEAETELENYSDENLFETSIEDQVDNATSVEELTEIRNQILQEGLPEQEDLETDIESQIDNATSVEELTEIRNQILQEGLPEQEGLETDIESQIDNATSVEELTEMRNQILQEGVSEQGDSSFEEYGEDKPKTLHLDMTPELLESRNRDTEETLENYRENLREYGVDEDAIEQYISQERDKINAQYEAWDRGDLDSNHYEDPTPNDWEGIAAGLKGDKTEISDIEGEVGSVESVLDPSEIDYDAVFEGLDLYDFDGVDYLQDAERLDSSLGAFQPERWQELDLNQQKEAMTELAEYVQEVTGLENPPTIEFYNNPVDGDYGGYMASTNTLSINEHMLYDSNEAADTVAHELWHAYQHERAMNPQSAKDYQYQYNFEHYISPKRDMFGRFVNFTEYQDQLVEAEARAFAEQFKGRLGGYSG